MPEPLLPEQADLALREAAGVPFAPSAPSLPDIPPTRPVSVVDPDDGERRGRPVLWAVIIAGALGLGTIIFLGRINAGRYAVTCSPDEITAEQGRGFPPWGTRAMTGTEWKVIAIPPNAECKPRDTDSLDELAGWYLDALVDRASAELANHDPARVEIAAAELDQALLLARAPERRDQRNDIARLQGDIEYWRATAKLAAAQSAMLDAAKQFDAAAAKRPRHVADATAWSAFVRKVVDQLHAGPSGAPEATGAVATPTASTASTASSGEDHPVAPPGVALPVEPAAEPTAQPAQPVVDAGVPGGGVLL